MAKKILFSDFIWVMQGNFNSNFVYTVGISLPSYITYPSYNFYSLKKKKNLYYIWWFATLYFSLFIHIKKNVTKSMVAFFLITDYVFFLSNNRETNIDYKLRDKTKFIIELSQQRWRSKLSLLCYVSCPHCRKNLSSTKTVFNCGHCTKKVDYPNIRWGHLK